MKLRKIKLALFGGIGILLLSMCSSLSSVTQNLLVNPEFAHLKTKDGNAHYVAGWNTKNRGDIEAIQEEGESYARISLKPGARVSQFFALADIDLEWKKAVLSLAVDVTQESPGAAVVRLSLMGIESSSGTWSPDSLGEFNDKRTFERHGRGELVVLDQVETHSADQAGVVPVLAEGLVVDWNFEENKKASDQYRNAAGILVEIENTSDHPILLRHPVLSLGDKAVTGQVPGRELPQWHRQIPRTMAKLLAGEPVYILTLGSSIDRGSANPRMYPYDENPASPTYKKPLAVDKPFLPELVQRPDLDGYIAWFQHYFMYTGRMRLELMNKFGYSVDGILLNVMACDGSSIGESHSGFAPYAALQLAPNPSINAHPEGNSWKALYPRHFKGDQKPVPDLIVFGHGHNERIDKPDEIAVFEGAIRWFQKHYPEAEFVNCMWIRKSNDDLNQSIPALCEHYGIPFIPVNKLIESLKGTANYFALAPDGGHPQASAHYLWFKQLEKAFEITAPLTEPLYQKHLPQRMNPYSYLWEGEMTHFAAPHPRLVESRMMIVEDGPFNIWAKHDGKDQVMQILIDGKVSKDAGRGRNYSKRDVRNSTFVHGHLSVGDRHIFEITGKKPKIIAVDNKVAPGKGSFPAGDQAWQTSLKAEEYTSTWGHPYGKTLYVLKAGESISIRIPADILSVAWLDREDGGTFQVSVDGKVAWEQDTRTPFITSEGTSHYIENRRAINGLEHGDHLLTITATEGTVRILGAFGYTL